jgi:hypothetical protein
MPNRVRDLAGSMGFASAVALSLSSRWIQGDRLSERDRREELGLEG